MLRTATSRGLWVDEAISVHQAQLPFGQMLRDMQTTDVHPPFHYALLWVTVRLFGTSEVAVRLPSLIAGVALIPALFWTGKVIFDRRTGWVAATLGVFAPFCVWYSQRRGCTPSSCCSPRWRSAPRCRRSVVAGAGDWALFARGDRGDAVDAVLRRSCPLLAQQGAFAVAWWRRRDDHVARRRLAIGWASPPPPWPWCCLPLLQFVRRQIAAYGHRTDGLVPGQAGAGSSTLGANISIYAVGANLIWAVWGYHSDGVMEQIAALWPLAMLVALVVLGRGRSGPSVLLVALVVVPLAALFLVGSVKRDLFELRYFSGAVPAALLLMARLVTATTKRRVAVVTVGAVVVATMAVALARPAAQRRQPPAVRLPGRARLGDGRGASLATCCCTSRATSPT